MFLFKYRDLSQSLNVKSALKLAGNYFCDAPSYNILSNNIILLIHAGNPLMPKRVPGQNPVGSTALQTSLLYQKSNLLRNSHVYKASHFELFLLNIHQVNGKRTLKALFTRRQGNPTARVTLARGLKDSSGLQAKFSGRVTLLPETTLRLLRFGDLASKARTVDKTGK